MSRNRATPEHVSGGGVRWWEVIAFGVLGGAVRGVRRGARASGIDSRSVSLWRMLTPAIAAFVIVWRRQRGNGFAAVARATSMWPLSPGRTVRYCLVVLFGSVGVGLVVAIMGGDRRG